MEKKTLILIEAITAVGVAAYVAYTQWKERTDELKEDKVAAEDDPEAVVCDSGDSSPDVSVV